MNLRENRRCLLKQNRMRCYSLWRLQRFKVQRHQIKIEGIYTSDERLKALVKDTTRPRSRNEREIAGYRDVLNTIHENHDYIPPKPSIILQLHRDLYKFEGFGAGGTYKVSDNIIEEEDSDGHKSVRFQPIPAWETPEAMEKIVQSI